MGRSQSPYLSARKRRKSYNAFWLTLAYDTNALEFTEAVGNEPLKDKRELQVSAKTV